MRRSGLALFCTLDNAWTQRVRIVAGEKGLPLELVEVPEGGRNAELAGIHPDAKLPTLVDRDVLLLDSAAVFNVKRFFLSDEFSLVDATIAPILWRLPALEVDLAGPDGQAITRYANQIFARPAFQRSLHNGRIHR